MDVILIRSSRIDIKNGEVPDEEIDEQSLSGPTYGNIWQMG